jgi:ACS family tartrate transporter-like MFS transporter
MAAAKAQMSLIDQKREKRIINKVTWRLVPFLVVAYLLCYIDRANLGFAALTMNKDLGFTATVFGWGAGIFFIGYFLFEVPSNLALAKFGARKWIARIAITWGIVSVAMSFVSGNASFLSLRFLLGAAEAGFYPGITYYLTFWFPERHRAVVFARFNLAQPFAYMIGATLSGLILKMNGFLGIAGWKWLFVLEGLPSVILGIITYMVLTDKPIKASWLAPEEREWLQGQIDQEHARVEAVKKYSFWQSLGHPMVLLLGFMRVGVVMVTYGVGLWLPQMVKALGHFSTSQIGFIVAVPYVFAAIGMLISGYSSDRTGERKYHMSIALVMSGVGLLGAACFSSNIVLTIICLSVTTVGIFAACPIFWMLPSAFLTGSAAAAGIALVNSIGNLGGFVGPLGMGWLKDVTGTFTAGLVVLAVGIISAGLIGFGIWVKTEKIKAAAMLLERQGNKAASAEPVS